MSTLNVDNINEYTTDGKVNVGHDIKLASGKSVLNSDGKKTGALVSLATSTASDSATITFDNFVITLLIVITNNIGRIYSHQIVLYFILYLEVVVQVVLI